MGMDAFRALSDQDLVGALFAKERDLVTMRFQHSMNKLENTATLKGVRRDVARIRHELRDRESSQGVGKDSLINSFRRDAMASVGDTPAESVEESGGFLKGIVDKFTADE
jgi:large subunit ribosomal protein L29